MRVEETQPSLLPPSKLNKTREALEKKRHKLLKAWRTSCRRYAHVREALGLSGGAENPTYHQSHWSRGLGTAPFSGLGRAPRPEPERG